MSLEVKYSKIETGVLSRSAQAAMLEKTYSGNTETAGIGK